MRISDWSSDVCSSDLGTHAFGVASHRHGPEIEQELSASAGRPLVVNFTPHLMPMNRGMLASIYEIGRASCRERVCPYVSISVVAGSLKKKNKSVHITDTNEPKHNHKTHIIL